MPLFFGMGRPVEATADIVALTGIASYLAYIWAQVDPVAGYLLVPYVAWLGYATYLSVSRAFVFSVLSLGASGANMCTIGWVRLPEQLGLQGQGETVLDSPYPTLQALAALFMVPTWWLNF